VPDPFGERVAFDELQHQIPRAIDFCDVVNARDVRMIERGKRFSFNLEARQTRRVESELIRQRLDRDVTLEPRVARPEHAAHPALAEERGDLIRAESCADADGHGPRRS
jgi:hypothetical protein